MAPTIFKAQKAAGAVTIRIEMPKAASIVWMAMPDRAPRTVTNPCLSPKLTVREMNSAMSGPGVMARTMAASAKLKMMVKSGACTSIDGSRSGNVRLIGACVRRLRPCSCQRPSATRFLPRYGQPSRDMISVRQTYPRASDQVHIRPMSKDINKVVLAYSGGLDTSIILKWLRQAYDCEV